MLHHLSLAATAPAWKRAASQLWACHRPTRAQSTRQVPHRWCQSSGPVRRRSRCPPLGYEWWDTVASTAAIDIRSCFHHERNRRSHLRLAEPTSSRAAIGLPLGFEPVRTKTLGQPLGKVTLKSNNLVVVVVVDVVVVVVSARSFTGRICLRTGCLDASF